MSVYTVTTAADSGDGSLRAAILAVNAPRGANTIRFDIPGSGVHTIALLSALPPVTAAATIDGTTQPGYAGMPLIALDGSGAGPATDGLTLAGAGNAADIVRGLDIESFSGNGIVLQTSNATVTGCFVGTDPTGTKPRGNGANGIVERGDFAMIGGTGTAANVISGNSGSGIVVAYPSSPLIIGNRIGTDPTGTSALGNGRYGIDVSTSYDDMTIGGVAAGDGNVISANGYSGIIVRTGPVRIEGDNRIGTSTDGESPLGNGWAPWAPNRDGVTVAGGDAGVSDATQTRGGAVYRPVVSGNFGAGIAVLNGSVGVSGALIGVNSTGSAAIGNGADGIRVAGGGASIGAAGDRVANVISGNTGDGIFATTGSRLTASGNLIGTNALGTAAIPNGGAGIELEQSSSVQKPFSVIGPGNIISANHGDGVLLGTDATVYGNTIGLDASASVAMGNGGNGVEVRSAYSTIGTTPGATATQPGNVIAANRGDGVLVNGSYIRFDGLIQIAGNIIGTNTKKQSGLGNAHDGIAILYSADNIVGGVTPGRGASLGNTIAYNGHNGITVLGPALGENASMGNQISENSIFSNGALGIDIGDDGVTPNAPPSKVLSLPPIQQFPVISEAIARAGSTFAMGTIQSQPGTKLMIELFDSPQPNPSGYGEGQQFIGSLTVSTDASGNTSFALNAAPTIAGTYITATATSVPNSTTAGPGNTSEFSLAIKVATEPALPGDFNGDGVVDFKDLAILASHYSSAGTYADGDMNYDGKVGFDDLVLLAQAYGKSSTAQTGQRVS